MVLGQPLNFSVQLRSDTGEPITPECIAAEVSVGDRRLPAAQVRASLESLGADGARVRVFTLQRIDEAVVSVQLTVGCQSRVTRRYMLMAEAASTAPMVIASQVPASPQAIAAAAAAVTLPAVAAARVSPVPGSPLRQERSAAPSLRPAKADRPPPASARVTAAAPRLRLEAAEPVLSAESAAVEQAIEVVAQAADGMRAAMAAASAAEQRVKTLERSVEQARNEAIAQREQVRKLQAQVIANEAASRWLWPLQIALLGAAVLAAALAWRLWKRPAAPAPMPEWREASESSFDSLAHDARPGRAATAPTPFVASDQVLPSPAAVATAPPREPALARVAVSPDKPLRDAVSMSMSMPLAGQAQPAPHASAEAGFNARTAPLPAGRGDDEGAPRDVSIEELIDLEQQAEFFVALGQDASAVDLLMEHLRLTGGGSPLPYLKLMEIYHRLGDQAAYERTRGRFNDRFNAYAPAWAVGPQQGRGLEDYPGVVPRLCQVWARPLDAMAELEALLFRKSRGDLFELPAYREVLFLYTLARDLFDRESADAVSVDLLLPLSSHGDTQATRPAPFDDSSHALRDGADDFGGRPTSPVDLDLSTPDKSASIFDPFEPRNRQGRR